MLGEYRSHTERTDDIERTYKRRELRGYLVIVVFLLLSAIANVPWSDVRATDMERIIELCHEGG